MISIELWRAKIGLFNCSRRSRPPSSIFRFINLQQQTTRGSFSSPGGGGLFSSLCRSLLTRRALALLLVAVITHLLLSAGDVEQNPGPINRDTKPVLQDLQYMSYTSEDGRTVHFRLMDRIKPRVTRLAIGLGFPQHIIANLETKQEPVFYLLTEWLRGGNQEVDSRPLETKQEPVVFVEWLRGGNQEHDSRPLTWRTLITALRAAGLLEEVKILEEHFVAAWTSVAERPERASAHSFWPFGHYDPLAPVCGDASDTLGDKDLNDLVLAVRNVYDWRRLGLQLGLTNSALDMYRQGHYGMLSTWLHWKDHDSQADLPSWSVLIQALRKIGEMAIADEIAQSKLSVAAKKEKQIAKKCIQDQHKVSIRSLKAFLIGPARVGKTTTRRRLTREIVLGSPNETVPSTGIDPPVTVSVLIGEKGWTSQDIGEQFRDLCSFLKQSSLSSSSNSSSSSSNSTTSQQRQSQSTATDLPVPVHQLSQQGEDNPALHIQDEVITRLSTLVETEQWPKIHEFLKEAGVLDLLHIVDIGGQPEFHEILPFLLHGPALNLIFFNLTKDIDSKYQVEYDDANGSKSSPYESDSTIREILQRALCTISSLQTSTYHKPAAILIGTHFEKSKEAEFLAVDDSVQAMFENQWFMKNDTLRQVSKPGEKRRYIYFLNNVSGDSSDINGLRDLIQTIVEKRFHPEKICTPHLLLHLFLRLKFERFPGWCSMKQCEDEAKRCGISKHDLPKALKYLHDRFGTVLYYPDLPKLGQRVIVNVNLIMKPPAEMIRTAFGAKDEDPNTAEEIRRTGVIPEYLINRACYSSKLDNGIPTDEILELLESCYILYKYADPSTKKDIHFMPCLLKPDPKVEEESSDPKLLSAFTYSPLLLIPSTHFVPLGLFQASVVKFSQDENWLLDESNRFRNRIRFYFNDDCLHVEICNLCSHLEVRILTELDEFDQRLITKFRYELWMMFDKVTSHTKDVHWKFGFYCPHGLQLGIRPHPTRCPSEKLKKVEVYEGTIKVVCSTSDCIQTSIPLKDKQNCWFKHVDLVKKPAEKDCPQRDINTDSSFSGASPAAPLTTQPQSLTPTESAAGEIAIDDQLLSTDDLLEVLEELTPIERRANNLGIALGLSTGSYNPTMESVIQTWLDQDYNTQRHQLPSYRRLVKAVTNKVGGSNPALAKKIAANHPAR